MRSLSFIIILVLIAVNLFAQSPHGKNFSVDCSKCHNTAGWSVRINEIKFDHSKTDFSLVGQHKSVQCRACHSSLVFSETPNNCFSCHKDIHSNSVSKDCSKCHSPQSWLVQNINHIHRQSRFPLIGNHQNQDCKLCHANYSSLNFTVQGIECYDCHKKDYDATKTPNHVAGNFSKDCQTCHISTSLKWSSSNTTHDFFPLTGGHSIGNCYTCHKVGSYSGLSKECYSCHSNKFTQTTNPNHVAANFSTACVQCHTINSWKPSSFNHSTTNFILTGRHVAQSCNSCHSTGYKGTTSLCYSCHKTNYESSKNPNHVSSKFPTTCEQCHSTSGWSPATFNHATTKFPLTGKHASVECASCHKTGYSNTSPDCYSCHQNNYTSTKNPNHTAAGFPTSCADCHTSSGWTPATFDHDGRFFPVYSGKHKGTWSNCIECHNVSTNFKAFNCITCHEHNQVDMDKEHSGISSYSYQSTACFNCHPKGSKDGSFNHSSTRFQLLGSHSKVDCQQCHKTGYANTSMECISCHQTSFDNSKNPNHKLVGISTDCAKCHDPSLWTSTTFSHASTTFILTGKHTTAACESCHIGKTTGTSQLCYSCHKSSFDNSKTPNHNLIGISNDCQKCHTTSSWTPSSFSHSTTTFLLTGKHTTATCESCHKGKTTGTNQLCYGCHKTNYDASKNPNHVTSNFPTTCEQCHTTSGWSPASFNHSLTKFPLVGSHTKVDCTKCHQTGYTNTSMECKSCHQTVYNSSTNPNHLLIGISVDCAKCHTATTWAPSSFSHAATSFPLIGQHNAVKCESCHQGKTTGTSQICNSCHNPAFTASKYPNHVLVGISTDCVKCHNTNAWIPSSFSHSSTPFILTGKHTSATCESCHKGKTTGTNQLCYSCHKTNYDASKNPNHVTSAFPTTCEQCHTTTGWSPATFNHSLTKFPLLGKHSTVPCASCHATGYVNTSTVCYSCHKANYDASKNPNHVTSAFPTACEQCHTTSGWSPATFNHATTKFPLTGKHTTVACASCHAGGYSNTSSACYSCHQTNYTQTKNPNHTTSSFPITCADCHTTNGWTPATFDHDGKYFPIYSGNHRGKWSTCTDCHNVASNYSVFVCTNCHEHAKTSTDKNHQGVQNYVYLSSACYNCHPKGRN